jgi:thiol-disulfide isomerase/thioredoxin
MTADSPIEEAPDSLPSSDPMPAGQGRVSPRVVFGTIAALAVVVVIGAIFFSDDGTDETATVGNGGLAEAIENAGNEGDQVPADSFQMFDGSTRTFADYAGQPLVVNFFASWCGPCRAEMPDFQTVHEELGDDVSFLGFAFQDREEDARALVAQTGVTYDLATDPGEFQVAFGGIAMPTTAFVDENGVIVEVHSGLLDQDGLRDRIAEHLGVGP